MNKLDCCNVGEFGLFFFVFVCFRGLGFWLLLKKSKVVHTSNYILHICISIYIYTYTHTYYLEEEGEKSRSLSKGSLLRSETHSRSLCICTYTCMYNHVRIMCIVYYIHIRIVPT